MGACTSTEPVHFDTYDTLVSNAIMRTSVGCWSDINRRTGHEGAVPIGQVKGRSSKRGLLKRKPKEKQNVLILGVSGSGKSTVMKQIRIMHGNAHSQEERMDYRKIILNFMVNSTQRLIDCVSITCDLQIYEYVKIRMEKIKELNEIDTLREEDSEAITTLWNQRDFQDVFKLYANEFPPSTTYFIDAAERICKSDFVPTEQDILMVERKTIGACIMELKLENLLLRVVDVGGQRKERRKWVHFFEGVTAVVFCVSLTEYDEQEDPTTNRMKESLQLFGDMLKNETLKGASVVLFLNKKDLFREKIKETNITKAFPLYTGAQDYDEAVEYIQQQFVGMNTNPARDIFCHTTSAVDIADMRSEWAATVRNIVFKTSSVVY